MTPRELSSAVITVKLEQISELLDVLDQLGEVTVARLRDDTVLRLALERVLTQLVELAAATNNHIGAAMGRSGAGITYGQSFELMVSIGVLMPELAAALKPSAGLRSVLVHRYTATDWNVVVASVPRFRSDYRAYVRAVSRWLSRLVSIG